LRGEPEEDHQYIARRKDGSTFQVESYSNPILEKDEVIGYRGVLYDITDRIRAEKELEQSEEKYRLLVQNMREGIVIINYDGIFLFANNSSANALEIDADKLIGMTMWDLFPKDIGERQLKNIRHVIDSGENLSEESRTFFNGKWRWYITDIQPFSHFGNDDRCAMIIAYDITERKTNEIRGKERLRLLDSLRFVEKIEDVLNIACTCIRDAELFKKALFILIDDNGKIVNMGQTGYSDADMDIDRKLAGIGKIDMASVPKEQRINNSLITSLDNKMDARSDGKWETGCLACVPLSSEGNKYNGWMILEEPFSSRMPLDDEMQFIEEVVEIVAKDIREIDGILQLHLKQKALEEKNIALREVLEHIEKEKLNIKRQLAKDVDQTLIPALKRLLKPDGSVNKSYYDVLSRGLNELALSTGGLLHLYARLTPREVDICSMLKTGATSQEIANDLYITLATVKKHRQMIRRKFGLSGKKINLESYLRQL